VGQGERDRQTWSGEPAAAPVHAPGNRV